MRLTVIPLFLLWSLMTVGSAKESDVVLITGKNVDSTVRKGKWLLEFYTDWCTHCQRLQPVWEEVATELKGKVNVGKVDGDQEPALLSRFKVTGYPSIFYLEDGTVREYRLKRTAEVISAFALEDYKEAKPMPWLYSPFGPIGTMKGWLFRAGSKSLDLYAFLVKKGTPGWLVVFGMTVVLFIMVALVTQILTAPDPLKMD